MGLGLGSHLDGGIVAQLIGLDARDARLVRIRVRVGVSSWPAAWAHARASSREMACPLTFHVRKAASMTRRVAVSVVEVRLGGAESGTMRSPPIWGTAPGLPRPGL